MADPILTAFVIFGGFIGSTLLTLFPYFMEKSKHETTVAEIKKKPEAQWTEEEQHLVQLKYPNFLDEYKFRFAFGIITGTGTVLAVTESTVANLGEGATIISALLAGIFASGFFSALADKIRAT